MKIKSANKRVGLALVIALPFYITFMAELNSTQSIRETFSFIINRPTVVLFNVLFLSALIFTLSVLFKRIYISIAAVGGLLYILSLVEYFKYGTSGTHFSVSDIFMVGDAADVTRFAKLSVEFWMVINLVTLLLYIAAAVYFKITIESKSIPVRLSGALMTAVILFCVLSPYVSAYVFGAFEIDTQESDNSFAANEKYQNNSFLANLLQTSTETISSIVSEPDGYGKDAVCSLLGSIDEYDSGSRPNIVFVACESFGDFRRFDKLDISSDIYKGFDTVAGMETAASGYLFSPTFGGYTTRAEFELLVGLPVKSLQNATIPHYLMNDTGELYSLARHASGIGYSCSYIHPFSETFYNRDSYYTRYGFDELIFDKDFQSLGVTPGYYGSYISDASAYDAVKSILERDDDAPNYIFLTTMQNHQPYVGDGAESELDVYLKAVRASSDALYDFVTWLGEFDEETVVVFVGDHFPYFSSGSKVYEDLGLRSDNCEILYEQQYVVYGNKEKPDIDTSRVISEFYLPNMILKSLDLPVSAVSEAVLSQLPQYPLYSVNASSVLGKNRVLDLLTYDIICGDGYTIGRNDD